MKFHQLAYNKINKEVFLDFLADSPIRKLSFSCVNFSDAQLSTLLETVHMRMRRIKQLKLHGVYLDTDKKLNLMNEFLAKTNLTKVKLSLNMLNNLDTAVKLDTIDFFGAMADGSDTNPIGQFAPASIPPSR